MLCPIVIGGTGRRNDPVNDGLGNDNVRNQRVDEGEAELGPRFIRRILPRIKRVTAEPMQWQVGKILLRDAQHCNADRISTLAIDFPITCLYRLLSFQA